MPRKKLPTDAVLKELRAFGLAYPGAHTKSPWPGHLDLAVKDKTFAYLSLEGEPFGISCKLPRSCEVALMLPFASPAGTVACPSLFSPHATTAPSARSATLCASPATMLTTLVAAAGTVD